MQRTLFLIMCLSLGLKACTVSAPMTEDCERTTEEADQEAPLIWKL